MPYVGHHPMCRCNVAYMFVVVVVEREWMSRTLCCCFLQPTPTPRFVLFLQTVYVLTSHFATLGWIRFSCCCCSRSCRRSRSSLASHSLPGLVARGPSTEMPIRRFASSTGKCTRLNRAKYLCLRTFFGRSGHHRGFPQQRLEFGQATSPKLGRRHCCGRIEKGGWFLCLCLRRSRTL